MCIAMRCNHAEHVDQSVHGGFHLLAFVFCCALFVIIMPSLHCLRLLGLCLFVCFACAKSVTKNNNKIAF